VMYGADALLRDLPLSRSRGNATGFAILGPELDIKRSRCGRATQA